MHPRSVLLPLRASVSLFETGADLITIDAFLAGTVMEKALMGA